jgi:hypothetical protein
MNISGEDLHGGTEARRKRGEQGVLSLLIF